LARCTTATCSQTNSADALSLEKARGSFVIISQTKPVPERQKQIKRLVREWAGIAHDRDLRKALSELRVQFDRWDRGEIDSFELNELVHRFHQYTAREIWKRYATTHLEPAVASAVAAGVLRKEELPAQLVQHIVGLIEFYEHDLSPP